LISATTFLRNCILVCTFSEIVLFSNLFAKSKRPGNCALCVLRDTIVGIYSSLLTNASHCLFFFHKIVSFYKGFRQTFLIKLSVFVRFDECYCEHSTWKDIKERFALRNTNGFREFSLTRSYRLSRHNEAHQRSNCTLLVDLTNRMYFIVAAKRHYLSRSSSAERFHC